MARSELDRRFLTVDETAEALRVGEATIRRAIARGELLAVRIGRHPRVPASEVERVLSGRGPVLTD